MNALDYRKLLGLSYNDEEKLNRFYAQMHNYFAGADLIVFDEHTETIFCNKIGVPIEVKNPIFSGISGEPEGLARVWKYIKRYDSDLRELIFCCVTLANVLPNVGKRGTKDELERVILDALDDCKLAYDIRRDSDGFFIFPKGAKELDDALVSEPLEWMENYPSARKAWISALKDYSELTEATASETADNFRKALERFFQEFFDSDKSLENLKSEYGAFLTSKGVPAELKNNFEKLLESYTKYNNNFAKHHDKVSRNVLEYIMYQTGNLIRLLITLKQEDTTNAN